MTFRIRAPIIAVAIGVVAAANYWFVHRPEPHSVAEFNPIQARLGREELILSKPVSAGDTLFSHQGGKNEVVEIFVEQGVFSPATRGLLRGQSWAQGNLPQPIAYTTLDADGAHGPPCRTFVEVKPAGTASDVHLFQDGIAGGENHREFSLKAIGAGLQVDFLTEADNPAETNQPGCRKLLQAGENQIELTGMIPVSVVAGEGSAVRLKFLPASSTPLWEGNRGLFEPFAAVALRAASARLSPIDSKQTLFLASVPVGQPELSLDGFLAGSDRIEMRLSGVGWVSVNGHAVGPTFGEWLVASNLRAGIVLFLDLALLCGLAVFAAGSAKGAGHVFRWATGGSPIAIPDPARGLVVFLCHCSENKQTVRAVSGRLRTEGFQPWLDEDDIFPARLWDTEIKRGLRSSHAVVVCLSPIFTRKEGYVQKELRYALDLAEEKPERDTFLIPLRLEDCEIPESLGMRQYIDWFKPEGCERLLRVLHERAREVESAASAPAAGHAQ
jgi:hypothetical protein